MGSITGVPNHKFRHKKDISLKKGVHTEACIMHELSDVFVCAATSVRRQSDNANEKRPVRYLSVDDRFDF